MWFTKMHALGNDFVALNGFTADGADWRALSISMCDRHFGAGADGLFVALPSEVADVRMLFFNPDGTEDRCGNGLRCFGRFLHDQRITDRTHLLVETYGGIVDLNVELDGDVVDQVTVDLGPPVFDPALIPARVPSGPAMGVPLLVDGREWLLNIVSTGTPHAVVLVDEMPDDETFYRVSPAIEVDPLFPEKISVMWTRFVDPRRADMRIWERATGETLGCGTGAAAVAVVGRLLGLSPGAVSVRSVGGVVLAAWDGADAVTLTGPAHPVYSGEWPAHR